MKHIIEESYNKEQSSKDAPLPHAQLFEHNEELHPADINAVDTNFRKRTSLVLSKYGIKKINGYDVIDVCKECNLCLKKGKRHLWALATPGRATTALPEEMKNLSWVEAALIAPYRASKIIVSLKSVHNNGNVTQKGSIGHFVTFEIENAKVVEVLPRAANSLTDEVGKESL